MSLELESLLYAALDTPFGVCVESIDAASLRQRLYALRKTREDFQRLSLQLSRVKPKTELWIVKKDVDIDAPE